MKKDLLTPDSKTSFELYDSGIVVTIKTHRYANLHYSVVDGNVLLLVIEPVESPKIDE